METQFQQALALHNAGQLEEAEALYRRMLDWRPAWTCGNLGALLRITGRLEEAEALLRRALAEAPENLPNRHSLGMTLLQRGRWTEAWPLYEARHQLDPRPHPPLPAWGGESLAGKRIVVTAEQGLGDMILFSRFLPLLTARAAEVVVAAPRVLVRLLDRPDVRAVHPESWESLGGDVWTFIGSVPRWLEAGPEDAPIAPPNPFGRGLGLMTEGGGINPNPLRLPPPEMVATLRGLGPFRDLAPAATGAPDMAATAQIIAGLAGVVTVDTSVAHLAASLGKPTWVLLPRPASDWYSRWEDDRSPWYPTMRTIRQTTPGDWTGVVTRLAEQLRAEVQASKSRPTSP